MFLKGERGGKEINIRRDKLKNKKIAQNSQDVKYFIRFNYKEKITKEYVIKKLINNNVPIK